MTTEESAASADPSFAAPVEPERTFKSKRLDNRDYWTQEGYANQAVQVLAQDSLQLKGILAANPDLAKIVNIVDEVTFEYDGKWYRVAN